MTFLFGRVERSEHVTVESNGRLKKTYDDTYLAIDDSATAISTDDVLAGIGVLPGAPHPNWSAAICIDINVTQGASRAPHCYWHVSYHYSTFGEVPESQTSTAPDERRIRRKFTPTTQQRFILKDRLGNLITDAAGSCFDGGVPVDVRLGTLTFERDILHVNFDLETTFTRSGSLNSATWLGAAIGTVMLDMSAEEKWEGGYHFWTVTYTFCYDKDGWQPHPANAGLYQLPLGVADRRTRIVEDDGTPTVEPQPLYANGALIPESLRATDGNFIAVDYYPTFDFNTLNLPLT